MGEKFTEVELEVMGHDRELELVARSMERDKSPGGVKAAAAVRKLKIAPHVGSAPPIGS